MLGAQINLPVNVGSYSAPTQPTAVTSGLPVQVWLDAYGRVVLTGSNQVSNTIDITDVSPALQQTLSIVNLSAVTATGAGTSIAGNNYNKITVVITASSVTTGGTIQIEGSYDNTNFGLIPIPTTVVSAGIALSNNILTISANGTYVVTIEAKIPYLRTNVATRTDGTYTTSVMLGC